MDSLLTICESIFGEYEPIITTVTLTDGTEQIIQSIDLGYIAGVVVFCIAFYSLFRIIGSLFKGV